MVKSVRIENNQFIFSDDAHDLEQRVGLPSLPHTEQGRYSDFEKRELFDANIHAIATQRGYFRGGESRLVGREGDDIVYMFTRSREEIGRIAVREVPPVYVTKYLRLQLDEAVAGEYASAIRGTLPENFIVRLWNERNLRGPPVCRGIEIGLTDDCSLVVYS